MNGATISLRSFCVVKQPSPICDFFVNCRSAAELRLREQVRDRKTVISAELLRKVEAHDLDFIKRTRSGRGFTFSQRASNDTEH